VDLLLEAIGVALRTQLDPSRWSVGVHGSGENCYLLVHRIIRNGGYSWNLSVLNSTFG
jgi:hypothetical protein